MENIHSLVCSGGGVKGMAYTGAFRAMKEAGVLSKIDTFVGTSIGAVVAMLISIGYSPEEFFGEVMEQDFSKIKHIEVFGILSQFGIDPGDKLLDWIKGLVVKKIGTSDITMKGLFEKTKKKLVVCAVNLNKKKPVYIDHTTHPDMPVLLAIRMSFGIPIYFTSTRYKEQGDDKESLFVDGGVLDNFPIHLCKQGEVIGLRLVSRNEQNHTQITNLEEYIYTIVDCLLCEIDRLKLTKDLEGSIVDIDTSSISVLKFAITKEEKLKLIDDGYTATKAYLDKFSAGS